MFSERLKKIMDALEAKPSDLAGIIGCDRSNISRFLNGSRIPKYKGSSIRKLAEALTVYADRYNKRKELADFLGGSLPEIPEQTVSMLMYWLYEGTEGTSLKPRSGKDLFQDFSFGQKFDAVMKLTGLSNSMLAYQLNVDTSYISRFRNGHASPLHNKNLTLSLIDILLKEVTEKRKTAELAEFMNVPVAAMSGNDAHAVFTAWLLDPEQLPPSWDIPEVSDSLDFLLAQTDLSSHSFQDAIDWSLAKDSSSTYYGEDGLRRAALRLLTTAIHQNKKEIFLYYNIGINWITKDPSFYEKFFSLLSYCLKEGIKIHYFHQTDSNYAETNDLLRLWLPLCASGLVQVYLFKSTGRQLFSTALLFCPGCACVNGFNLSNARESSGIYRYDTDYLQLFEHQETVQMLLQRSERLLQFYSFLDMDKLLETVTSSFFVLRSTLSLATMSVETLQKVLARSGLSAEHRETLLSFHSRRFAFFDRVLKTGFVHELLPLPTPEEISAGKVFINLPGVLTAYTIEEYSEHIRNILRLMDHFPNYRVYFLPQKALGDSELLISGRMVAFVRDQPSYSTVLCEYASVCLNFLSYAKQLEAKYAKDDQTVGETLEKLLSDLKQFS